MPGPRSVNRASGSASRCQAMTRMELPTATRARCCAAAAGEPVVTGRRGRSWSGQRRCGGFAQGAGDPRAALAGAALGFIFPADCLARGASLAQETRCPAVGNRVMSVPISAMSSLRAGLCRCRGSHRAGPPGCAKGAIASSIRPVSSSIWVLSRIDAIDHHGQQIAMVVTEMARSAPGPARALFLPRMEPPRQVRQHVRVTLPGDQRPGHRPPRDAQDVRGDRRQLDALLTELREEVSQLSGRALAGVCTFPAHDRNGRSSGGIWRRWWYCSRGRLRRPAIRLSLTGWRMPMGW